MKDGRPGNVSFIGCQSCISMAVHGSVFWMTSYYTCIDQIGRRSKVRCCYISITQSP